MNDLKMLDIVENTFANLIKKNVLLFKFVFLRLLVRL